MDNKPEQKSSNPVQKVKRSGWKRFFGKKWVFPGIYMLAAALILALMWWYQDSRMSVDPNDMGVSEEQQQDLIDSTMGQDSVDDAVPAGAEAEDMIRPVEEDAEITMGFYDDNASEEEKEAALVEYGQSFNPHTGIDFTREDGETFAAVAALSGTVASVETHPLNGQVVRIEHDGGLETVYQSLDDVQVKEGDAVTQGDAIGTAGRSKVEKDSGVHVHFEVRQDGEPVNPQNHLPTSDTTE